jgi:alanyl-tRNA synthetase
VVILGESSIGSNLRRVEALTGLDALRWFDRERRLLAEITTLLRATRPEDAPEALRRRLEALADAQRELEQVRAAQLTGRAAELAGRAATVDGGWLVVEQVPDAGTDELRRIAAAVRDHHRGRPGMVVLGSAGDGKAALVAMVTADLVDRGLAAREVLLPAAKVVGGGAGGQRGEEASRGTGGSRSRRR